MAGSPTPTDPTETPILNTPYDPPEWHWSLDGNFRACAPALAGRRPSGAYLPVPKPRKSQGDLLAMGDQQESCSAITPHVQINQIRDAVQDWRERGYPGATPETMSLIEHWSQPEREGLKPYFCQRDAVETAIYLVEADDKRREGFNLTLGEINANHNDGIPRVALKLATGTGKTLVMAMLILWQAKNGYCQDFLLLVPNLTIRDRLSELRSGSEIYDHLRPAADRTRFRITVLNFQAWQQRTGLGVDGKVTAAQKRIIGMDEERFREATTESEDEMVTRLLKAHQGRNSLCVINDEAHHCYSSDSARGTRMEDSAPEETQAMMWFGAIQALQKRGRIKQVYDLSATPMWLRRPTPQEPSVLFPWTVSDFPLVDAIEAGLVKIPRVPIRDDSGGEVPAFRNLHTAIKDEIGKTPLPRKGHQLPEILFDALRRMNADYNRIREVYEPRGITPILIVVADTVANAERLFAELGGWREDGHWVQGRFSIFSNVDEAGEVKRPAPTLLVHSRMDESDKDSKLAGKASDADNSAVHAPDEKLTAADRMQAIRDLFNTAGKSGEPGEHLRCIVSVGMLTEGWDATAVTHVVGYRHFGSDLLCEQVAGRALRRSVVPEPGAEQTAEYANIVGIPFLNMMSKEKGDPGQAKERWPVFTLPNRPCLRMDLPRIQGWRRDRPGRTARLRVPLDEFRGRRPSHTGDVTLEALGGVERDLRTQDSERKQSALWRLATRVLERSKVEWNGDAPINRIETFASVVRATGSYLRLRGIDVRSLTRDEAVQAVSADLANHLDWADSTERTLAVMDDPQESSTWGQHFETTLLRYPEDDNDTTGRSHLNAAACHSDFERQVAAILDVAEGIEAWVRNYRLGWAIPWYDPIHQRWHEYEPDFVARVPLDSTRDAHLVIEVKGRPDVRSDEKERAAVQWCRRLSEGAAADIAGPWEYAMLKDQSAAESDLRRAIDGLRSRWR